MNNYAKISLVCSLLIFGGCAGTHQLNPKGKKLPIDESQAFEMGYKKAIQENGKIWEKKGMHKAQTALSNYANEIKAIEAGKVARNKGYLNETRAIVVKNPDGSVTIKTVGGTLKNSLNANQIIDYYKDNKQLLPEYSGTPTLNNPSNNTLVIDQQPLLLKESFKLHSEEYIDDAKGKIADNKALLKKRIVVLPKNDLSKGIIDLYALNCSDDQNSFSCAFKNQKIKDSFCKETGVCK